MILHVGIKTRRAHVGPRRARRNSSRALWGLRVSSRTAACHIWTTAMAASALLFDLPTTVIVYSTCREHVGCDTANVLREAGAGCLQT